MCQIALPVLRLVLLISMTILTGMSDRTYTEDGIQRIGGVIAEKLADEFRAGFEALESIAQSVARIPRMEVDVAELKSDMKVVKAAVKDTNRELHTITRPGYVAEEPSDNG